LTPVGNVRISYSFSGGADGCGPSGELLVVGKTLYGVTGTCGKSDNGTVFALTID
jgi:uncharacterized repeat protein (TIGR03803 family)